MKKTLFLIVALLFSLASLAERVDLKLTGQQGDHVFITVPKSHSSNKEYLTDRATAFCYGKEFCFVHFWQAGEAAPKKFPLTDKEAKLELASYSQNRNSGLSRMLFNCKRFPEVGENRCFTYP